MNLYDIVERQTDPIPWSEGDNIPWDKPEFSTRMLKEHLNQSHDSASRRKLLIDQHVNWIHRNCLNARPSKILDLGCGPGLYTSRLARMGHACIGIDFSPASIDYAIRRNEQEALECQYIHADIRSADFGEEYDLVMLIFGEFNVFRFNDANRILAKAHAALKKDGKLLLEAHTYDAIYRIGTASSSWSSLNWDEGLFTERPYLHLEEYLWNEHAKAAIKRHYIIDAIHADVQVHANSMQAYSQLDYEHILLENGFNSVNFYPGIIDRVEDSDPSFWAIMATRTEK